MELKTANLLLLGCKSAVSCLFRFIGFCLSGDGEIRTLVQTWNQYAFYMLSFDLVFDRGQDQNYQPKAYLLKSRTATGEQAVPAPILLAPPYRNVSEQGNRVMSRFCHCGRNKANLLCFG